MAREPNLAASPPPLDILSSAILPSTGGTYGIVLTLAAPTSCTIGALGSWHFPAGSYLYVGSAWGSGGLRARVSRHLRGTTARRWHIDYLRALTDPIGVWVARDERLECAWARALSNGTPTAIVVPRFGASDCRCPSHLFFVEHVTDGRLTLPGDPRYYALTAAG